LNGKDIYVITAKIGCCIIESESFDQELPLPPELPHSLLTTTTNVGIVRVNIASYYACTLCHKKLTAQDSNVAKCANCGLKQNQEDTILSLTIFDDVIKDLLPAHDNPDIT
jgi:hypothetical protein